MVEAPTEEEAFWQFGPINKSVDTSGLFRSYDGISGEETGDSLIMVEKEWAQQLGFREQFVGGLAAMTRALVVVAMLHYLWLSFGNSLYAVVVTNTSVQPEVFGGITSTEDGSALTPRDCGLATAMTPPMCLWTVARRDTTSTTPSSPDRELNY